MHSLARVTYLLPIRAPAPAPEELTRYLRDVATWCPVVVVDGSAPAVFAAHDRSWGDAVRHVRPDPAHVCANGKVHGVRTGLDLVRTDVVVIADDDVRYDRGALVACVDALGDADVVRPQNHFVPCPWHACWDTGRTLLNRALGADFPGTLVVRTEVLRSTGGYDGDVLFENLELMRTVARAGGQVTTRADLYVRRLPPTTRHFARQRVRQAYDELARPAVLAVELSVLPVLVVAAARRRLRSVAGGAVAVVALAAVGRVRDGGRAHFPAVAVAFAPLWVLERAVCAWLAIGARARGGVRYGDVRIARAASRRPRP